ncbi:hypothetical protein Acr_13g0004420 [Actinidia rufa]|uniref:Phytocyanin domain-containing protein n=1 Tax=Actinidia rufa TaxID=165716 RepID=A0A7J0FK12_9ERIC|nr:hypothetical protein Acr_13g0004420 [Actinidia rufa]
MESHMFLSFVLVIGMCFVCSSQAHFNFYVGGRDVFKYKKGSDSILVVNKDDYYKCNKKPIQALEDGDSVFKFDRSETNTHKSPSPSPPPSLSPSPAPKTPTSSLSPSPASISPNAESPNESPMSMAPEHQPVDAHAPVPAPATSAALGGSGVYLLGLSCVILGCFFGLM